MPGVIYLFIMKNIILTLTLLGLTGCAQITTLKTQVATLKVDKHDACAAMIQLMGMGMYAYIGENKYLNRVTGETIDYDNLDDDCDVFLTKFRDSIPENQKRAQKTDPESVIE